MESIHKFLIEPYTGERYITKKNGFVVNASIDDAEFVERIAIVKSVPRINHDATDVKVGDLIIVHHNVFRDYADLMDGKRRKSKFYIKENLYGIASENFYCYSKDKGKTWFGIRDYIFCEPTAHEEDTWETEETYETNKGRIAIGNTKLKELGVSVGDDVCFSKNSEHQFLIEDTLYYRMRMRDLCIIL